MQNGYLAYKQECLVYTYNGSKGSDVHQWVEMVQECTGPVREYYCVPAYFVTRLPLTLTLFHWGQKH